MEKYYIYLVVLLTVIGALWYWHKKKQEKDMAEGVQIFDRKGDIAYDLTDPSIFFFGKGDTNVSATRLTGAVNDSRIKAGKTFIYVYDASIVGYNNQNNRNPQNTATIGNSGIRPRFVITNGQISWSYSATEKYRAGWLRMYFVYGGVME